MEHNKPLKPSIETLNMIDQYGDRRRIIPAEVKGKFRKLRTYVHAVLLLIFLSLPWISINGTQAVLLDIVNRRFELFGQVFLSHDAPLIFFIFAIVILLIFLSTALWGRVWCGWACPQTVFIDFVFRQIEIWVEGDYKQRRALAKAPLTFNKFRKIFAKWGLFLIVSSLLAHSFIAYFSGSKKLLTMMQAPPSENWFYFLLVGSVTALVLFDFGWFREQFCIIMCPYGRFQNVLMDQQSVSVVYNEKRGEPRKGFPGRDQKKGDCVSCNRCVEVCPTAIDIRNGSSQLECIGCTACIDACDEIMTRVNKPKGLIAYTPAQPDLKPNYFRPRVLAYVALLLICIVGFSYNLSSRKPYALSLMRAKDSPYQVSPDGSVLNHFKAHLHNQSYSTQAFSFAVANVDLVKMTQAQKFYELKPGESKEVHLFINFSKTMLKENGTATADINVKELSSGELKTFGITLVGPYSAGSSSEVTNP